MVRRYGMKLKMWKCGIAGRLFMWFTNVHINENPEVRSNTNNARRESLEKAYPKEEYWHKHSFSSSHLGVTPDWRMSRKNQIKETHAKAEQRLTLIKKIFDKRKYQMAAAPTASRLQDPKSNHENVDRSHQSNTHQRAGNYHRDSSSGGQTEDHGEF